jgi:hypothetical protein
MGLHDFPFDHQIVPITFESFHWKATDLTLMRLPRHAYQRAARSGPQKWISMSPGTSAYASAAACGWAAYVYAEVKLLDWEVKQISVVERIKTYAFEDRSYSQVRSLCL